MMPTLPTPFNLNLNDLNQLPFARWQEVSEAYEVLGDAEKRKQYDAFGTSQDREERTGPIRHSNIRWTYKVI